MLHKFLVSGYGLEPRQGFPLNSEQLKDDWECAIIQSCLLFQDHENLLIHSKNSLYLIVPEFEPQADSLSTGIPAIREESSVRNS